MYILIHQPQNTEPKARVAQLYSLTALLNVTLKLMWCMILGSIIFETVFIIAGDLDTRDNMNGFTILGSALKNFVMFLLAGLDK